MVNLLCLCLQLFDKAELLECIRKLVEVDQDWVPHSQDASLYIRPTFIGTEVSRFKPAAVERGWNTNLYPLIN